MSVSELPPRTFKVDGMDMRSVPPEKLEEVMRMLYAQLDTSSCASLGLTAERTIKPDLESESM